LKSYGNGDHQVAQQYQYQQEGNNKQPAWNPSWNSI
jgi:hypothetical protein